MDLPTFEKPEPPDLGRALCDHLEIDEMHDDLNQASRLLAVPKKSGRYYSAYRYVLAAMRRLERIEQFVKESVEALLANP